MPEWLVKLSVADKIYLLLLTATAIILTVNYKRVPKNLRPLLFLAAVHLITELIADYIHFSLKQNNIIVYHFLSPIEYIIVSIIFYRSLNKPAFRRAVLLSVPIFVFLVGIFEYFLEPPNHNNSLAIMTETILVVSWCFLFFRGLLDREDGYQPEKDQTFWVLIGILFYFLGNFFILGTLDYFIEKDVALGGKIYYAGYAFNYLLYLIISLTSLVRFRLAQTHE
ncbi:hypothetical protein [Larkinella soli]|uniref:hypothetical protein n=1 Tax=Larkinella soli TaxID=1770527 RepID=UPI000FFBE9D2|nr:hypothetical protein [Larkinella soli]